VGAGDRATLAPSFSTAAVTTSGWAAIGAVVACIAGAHAESNKADKLVMKNKFLATILAFMAIPLFLSQKLSERVGFLLGASSYILFIGYPTWRKNA
jgi:hypothetical protein